jgi:hypothetical protein
LGVWRAEIGNRDVIVSCYVFCAIGVGFASARVVRVAVCSLESLLSLGITCKILPGVAV